MSSRCIFSDVVSNPLRSEHHDQQPDNSTFAYNHTRVGDSRAGGWWNVSQVMALDWAYLLVWGPHSSEVRQQITSKNTLWDSPFKSEGIWTYRFDRYRRCVVVDGTCILVKDSVCDSVTLRSMPQNDSSTLAKDSVYDSVRPRCMPHVEPAANQVIANIKRQLSFDEMELDGKAGFSDVAGNGIDSSGLSHNESFGVDDMDLNVPNDHVVNESDTHVDVEPAVDVGRTKEHVNSGDQVDYDVDKVDSTYETQYHGESSEDAGTNGDDEEDDDFCEDVPFDNIGVTSLVLEDVLVREDVDVVNPDGFDNDISYDNETSTYRMRRISFHITFAMSNQQDIYAVRAERLAKTHDPLALMANTQTLFHPDQPSHITYMQHPQPNNNYVQQPLFNTNYMQQPMQNTKDISDPTTAIDMALTAQSDMNMDHDRQMLMVEDNVGNQFRPNAGNHNGYNAVQNVGNQLRHNAVQISNIQKIANQSGNGKGVAARAEGNENENNENQIRCYNCQRVDHYAGNCIVKPRKRDAAYL
ncbi:hypothetical protein Tco_0882023 [Tanacetum coccineum]